MTLLISCYSFTAVAQRAEKLMPNGGSMLTLTYYGAEKWMPHYNVMGVAKAALEASVMLSGRRPRREEHPRQCDLRGSDQDPGGLGHRRFPLHPEVERVQRAPAPFRDDRGGRRKRRVPPVADYARGHHRRNPSCRCRLSHRRHEEPSSPRHGRAAQGLDWASNRPEGRQPNNSTFCPCWILAEVSTPVVVRVSWKQI